MGGEIPIKYNFYHPAGDGRDSFIHSVSQNQTGFVYVPKAPEFVGTRQPGMACSMAGLTGKPTYTEKPPAVSGYTGLVVPPKGYDRFGSTPTPSDAFPALPQYPLPPHGGAPMKENVKDFLEFKANFAATTKSAPDYKMPSYGGHFPGHMHVCGFGRGAICLGAGAATKFLGVIGPGAPGSAEQVQEVRAPNLQKGAVIPAGIKYTKAGYTGHLHGKNYSTNYGESDLATREKLLTTNNSGYIKHIGEYTEGEAPVRLQSAVSGYVGFKPRTTPDAPIQPKVEFVNPTKPW